jgi:hypothetical protein
MDPNAALEHMRNAVKDYKEADAERYSATTFIGTQQAELDAHRAADAMVKAFDALDGWLSMTGVLPDDWKELV